MRCILTAAILGLGVFGLAMPAHTSWVSEMARNTSVIIAPNGYPAYPPYYAPPPLVVAQPYVVPAYVAPPVVVPAYPYGPAVYQYQPNYFGNHHHHHHH